MMDTGYRQRLSSRRDRDATHAKLRRLRRRSAHAIERAREYTAAEGLRNVTFERADAQVHPFPRERFDLAVSRFGTMFFDDPGEAFVNIRRALRPAGRLVIAFTDAGEPVYYGLDVAAAFDWVSGFRFTSEPLDRMAPAVAARAVERLRATLAAHLSDDGVWFGSRAWIVTARGQ